MSQLRIKYPTEGTDIKEETLNGMTYLTISNPLPNKIEIINQLYVMEEIEVIPSPVPAPLPPRVSPVMASPPLIRTTSYSTRTISPNAINPNIPMAFRPAPLVATPSVRTMSPVVTTTSYGAPVVQAPPVMASPPVMVSPMGMVPSPLGVSPQMIQSPYPPYYPGPYYSPPGFRTPMLVAPPPSPASPSVPIERNIPVFPASFYGNPSINHMIDPYYPEMVRPQMTPIQSFGSGKQSCVGPENTLIIKLKKFLRIDEIVSSVEKYVDVKCTEVRANHDGQILIMHFNDSNSVKTAHDLLKDIYSKDDHVEVYM